jgi:hypothetical protein
VLKESSTLHIRAARGTLITFSPAALSFNFDFRDELLRVILSPRKIAPTFPKKMSKWPLVMMSSKAGTSLIVYALEQ